MGKVVKAVGNVIGTVASVLAVIPGPHQPIAAAVAVGANLASSLIQPEVPQSATQLGRLQARLDTQAPRKIVLGPRTAMPADIRYYEGSGENDEYIDYIVVCAAHRVGSIDEIWFEDQKAWAATGGVQPPFAGYLTAVDVRLEGTSANTIAINGGTRWGTDCRLTGCAYLRLRIKRTGNSDDEQSPLANGLPGRVTIIGEGMPCYDPRFDSTAGGSGTQRLDDQSTWGPSADDPIIQSLNVLIGWRINGELSVGAGLPAKYLDLESAITGANICDEDIALSTGGTQKRYRTAGAFSTDDAPMAIVGALLAGCAGDLLDSDGRLSFLIKTNTLATPAVIFDDHDILSGGQWDAMGGQTNLPNIVSGSYTDPSDNSLFQMVPYPTVKLPSEDGIQRTLPLDLGTVDNAARGQRIVKQTLQRKQYPGTFAAEFNMKGMAAKVGRVVWLTRSVRGWVNKPFRVVSQTPSRSGRIALVLREEHASIYAWAAEDSASVQAAAPVGFDPRNSGPILLARQAGKTAEWPGVSDPEGTKPDNNATVGAVVPDTDGSGGNLWDTTGDPIAPGVVRNDLLDLTAEGIFGWRLTEESALQEIGRIDLEGIGAASAADLTDANNRITTEIGRVDGLIADTDALVTAEVGRLDGLIGDTDSLVTTEIERVDGLLSTLRTDVDGNHASVTSDIATLQNENVSQAASLTALDARLQIDTDVFSLNFGDDAYEAPGETVDARALFLEEQSVRASQNAVVVRDVNLLSARVGDAEADILTDRQARVDGDAAIASDLTALTSRVSDAEADIVSEQTARSDADSALATDLTALTGRVGDAEADIVSEQTARADADSAIASDVAVLQGRVDDADAAVLSEQQARIDGDAAIASDLTALTSRVDEAEADIVSEQQARSTADEALASDLTVISAQLEIPGDVFSLNFGEGAYEAEADTVSVRAALLEEGSARASQNAAFARSVSILTARVGDAEADILSEQQARIDADGAIATDVTALTTRIEDAEADILSEQTARSDGDSALATDITGLTTRVGDNEAAVTAQAASIDGLEARYGVTLDVNGHVTGFAQNNDGTTGSFTVVADEFAIVPPGGGAATAPFIVDDDVVYIAQGYIKELAVDKIAPGTLGAEINVGAGKIIYDNGTFMKVTGVGFGSSSQFLEWFGPKMAIASCTEANAITYLKTDGSAYFGGTLSAGTLKNAATSTSLAGDASLTVGPFGSNGNPIVLVTSYFGRSSYTLSFPGTAQGKSDWESAVATWGATATGDSVDASKSISCNVVVRIDRNGTTGWATLTITSGTERLSGVSPAAVGESTPGFLEYTREVSGSITSTDSAGGTTDRTFTATITTRTGVVTGTLGTQQLSLTATEE